MAQMGRPRKEINKTEFGHNDIIVRIEANHSCMTARGIKKPSSKTVKIAKSGVFKKDKDLVNDFLEQVK